VIEFEISNLSVEGVDFTAFATYCLKRSSKMAPEIDKSPNFLDVVDEGAGDTGTGGVAVAKDCVNASAPLVAAPNFRRRSSISRCMAAY
jgi:hypothetical protein